METTKKIYTVPAIETISIDNEISLALESAPPTGPLEIVKNNQDYFSNNPFHTENV
jgi:hypothetical protein